MARIRVGVFDTVDRNPDLDLGDLYRQRLEFARRAEAAGIDLYQVAEHHLQPTGEVASPSVFLGALAQVTERMRIGPLVYQLSLYHPVRLAEEICMLDQMSGGRLDVGIGRGFSPWELAAYHVAEPDTKAIFEECVGVVTTALRTGRVDHTGRFFNCPDVTMSLRPVQKPYPPLWYPTSNPQSIPWVAAQGLNLVTSAATADLDSARGQFSMYRRVFAETAAANRLNGHIERPLLGTNRLVYVAATDEQARDEVRAAHRQWADNINHQWLVHGSHRSTHLFDLEDNVRRGAVMVGSPETVRGQLQLFLDVTGANYFAGTFIFGNLPVERAEASLRMFMAEVYPALEPVDGDELDAVSNVEGGRLAVTYTRTDIV